MASPQIAVLQFPGSNCETETARAVERAGMTAQLFRWNDDPAQLQACDGFVIGGGFSYQDRVRAGVIAAKEPVLDKLTEAAAAGKPVLGICNGAQVLVEAGLVPGHTPGEVQLALATNVMQRDGHTVRRDYYCNWSFLRCGTDPERCAFTVGLARGQVLPIPFAHGEGRFITRDADVRQRIRDEQQIAFQYATPGGEVCEDFPVTPNGSMDAIAGLCNLQGNVLALMPHPERALYLRQVPDSLPGDYGEQRRAARGDAAALMAPGPGYWLFASMARYLGAPVPA